MARLTYESFLERAESPQEGWELLATEGVIPDHWIDDPRRRFPCPKTQSRQVSPAEARTGLASYRIQVCPACNGAGVLPRPATLRNVWAFAQMRDHVVRAEALVLESYQPIREFGFTLLQPASIAWVATDARPAENLYIVRAYEMRSVVLSGIPLRPEWLWRFDGLLMMRDRATRGPEVRDPLERRAAALWELATMTCGLYPYHFTSDCAVLRWIQPSS